MNKINRYTSAILILCVGVYCAIAQNISPRKLNVAVLDFEAREGVGRGEAASLSDIFSAKLAQTGQYTIIDRNRIKAILTEQGFQQSEACSSVECVVEVGKILNVQKIFAGVIGKIGRLYTVNVHLINVTTAQIELQKSRQHEGEIEDLATTIIPEIANDMTALLTGREIEMEETTSSPRTFHRHEIEVGFGGGPDSKAQIFNRQTLTFRLADEVHVRPKNVFHMAYRFSFSQYFSLGLRMTSFIQKIDHLPVIVRVSPILITSPSNESQEITVRINTLSFEGRLNFIRGSIEPYGTLSLGLAFGNIGGSGSKNALGQQNFDGPAIGFGLGSRFYFTNRFGATLDLRVLGISAAYRTGTPWEYRFSSDKFDGSYNAAFIILFYQL